MTLGKSCRDLANALAAIKLNGEEALWSVRPDGLYHASMDPSHVQLIEVRAAAKKVSPSRKVEFATNVTDMLKVLNRAASNDSIQFSMAPDHTEKPADYRRSIHMSLSNPQRKLEYDVYLIETTNTIAPLPKHEPQVTMKTEASTIQEVLADIAVTSNTIAFETDVAKRAIRFTSSGDTGKAARTLEKSDGVSIEPLGENTKPVIAKFDIERMAKYLKAIKADNIIVEYATAKPLKIMSSSGNVSTTFYLAPRAPS